MTLSSRDVHIDKPLLQLIRYGSVGLVSNLIIYLLYVFITHVGIEPKISMTLVYILGVFIGFIANRNWTFAHQGSPIPTALRYAMGHLLGYLLNFLILFTFVDHLGYAHEKVQAIAIIVVAGFLFFIFKYYVFPKNSRISKKT